MPGGSISQVRRLLYTTHPTPAPGCSSHIPDAPGHQGHPGEVLEGFLEAGPRGSTEKEASGASSKPRGAVVLRSGFRPGITSLGYLRATGGLAKRRLLRGHKSHRHPENGTLEQVLCQAHLPSCQRGPVSRLCSASLPFPMG